MPGLPPLPNALAALLAAAFAAWRLGSRPLAEAWLDVPLVLFLLAAAIALKPRAAAPAASVAAALLLAVYLRLQVPLLAGLLAP
jgi:hypothetical protein